ncbi:MAG TPA: insulinase family protein [Blastocatellia bacterium]|nr:insulinase family protein [Blastocatellia bacterium]
MRRLKSLIASVSAVMFITTSLTGVAAAQSGRTRPRVPTPGTSSAAPVEPVKVPAASVVVKQEQVGSASRFVLQNGVTVIIKELHSAPLVAVEASVAAGTDQEPETQTGVARLAQRMILRGTTLRPNALRDLRALGGVLQTSLSYQSAAYSLVAPPNKVNEAMAIQGDLLMNPALDGEALRREIPLVVAEERWRAGSMRGGAQPDGRIALSDGQGALASDDASAYALARLINLAFAGTRAGSDRAAGVEALRTLTRDQLLDFYRAHYRPDRLTITVVGDVIPFNALVALQKLYAPFGASEAQPPATKPVTARPAATKPTTQANRPQASAPRPAAQSPTPQPPAKPEAGNAATPSTQSEQPAQPALRYKNDRGDINQTLVTVGFRVPGASSPERAALELLAAMLGQGRASRLQRALFDSQLVVTRVAAGYVPVADDGLLAIQMQVMSDAKGNALIDRAEALLLQELDAARREIPGEGEMARARAVAEKRLLDRSESYASRAALLAEFEASKLSFRDALDYRARLRAVRAEDVQRVAARYLTTANLAVHEYEPILTLPRTFDAGSFAATATAWASGLAQTAEAIKPRAAAADAALAVVAQGAEPTAEQQAMSESLIALPVKDYSTLNGPVAFVREDHSLPVTTVALLFQGGRVLEDEATSGITELMLRAILMGTPRRLAPQLANEWDQLGAEISVVNEPDFFGYLLSVPSRNADRALRLLRDVIEEPAFRDTDMQRAQITQLGAMRGDRDTGRERARELMRQAMWPGHAYALPPHGREEVIAKVTEEQLRAWHERTVKRQQPQAFIVGDTSGSALVSSQLAEGFRRRELEKSLQVKIPQPQSGEHAESRRREQADLAAGFNGPKAEAADRLAVELLRAAMNGEGGRLLGELRDRQGLALAAWCDNEANFVAGNVTAQLLTDAASEAKARAALLAELDKLARTGLDTDEAVRARLVAVTTDLAELQRPRERALEYARASIYRHQPADVEAFAAEMEKLTSDDAKRAAAAYFKSPPAFGILHGAAAQTPKQP